MVKTNVTRMCTQKGIPFSTFTYTVEDGFIDGIAVADKINKPYESVFKTLVTIGASGQNYVFMVPVNENLDLKKAAQVVSEKYVEMIPSKDLLKISGYMKGGCSPIGMKKQYTTVIDETIVLLDEITFSAGKIGVQINMATSVLTEVLVYQIADIV